MHRPTPCARRRPRPWLRLLPALVASLTLAACSSMPDTLETAFGAAARQALWLQTADPLAPQPVWRAPGSDGEAARRIVQRHYRSLETPDAAGGVLNSGVGQNRPQSSTR
jgi:hypothetical protein